MTLVPMVLEPQTSAEELRFEIAQRGILNYDRTLRLRTWMFCSMLVLTGAMAALDYLGGVADSVMPAAGGISLLLSILAIGMTFSGRANRAAGIAQYCDYLLRARQTA